MSTKTREPLAVLKDYSARHGIPDDFDEAIAQPEARGGVDVDKMFHAVSAYVSPADRSHFRAVLTAALTGERSG